MTIIIDRNKDSKKGFTLIELLVVISIISLMSTVIFSAVNSAKAKSSIARLKLDSKQIQTQVDITRNNLDKTVVQIDGDLCDFCNFADNQPIMTQTAALNNNDNDWKSLGFKKAVTDAWGRPYIMDENEGDPNWTACTVHDIVYSVGANGLWESSSYNGDKATFPGIVTQGLGDDYYFNLTFYSCPVP